MQIKETSTNILTQIGELVLKMDNEQYTAPLECLMSNSVGKHVRHILEFYELMIEGYDNGVVNYDKRQHDKSLEEDRSLALHKINAFRSRLSVITEDKNLKLETSYFLDNDQVESVSSSFLREMVYNIEHAIHHMAIIKIGILQAYPDMILEENFGIAYSTVKFKEKECAQ